MDYAYQDGFYYYPFESLSGEGRSLIVILHGHHNHPNKFLAWVEQTRKENPHSDVLVVRAPIAMHVPKEERIKPEDWPGEVEDLYTWLELDKKPTEQKGMILSQVFNQLSVVKDLNHFIDCQLAKRNLRDENLGIIGFSMGGIMAVQAGFHRRKKPAAIVCHSGAVLPFTKAAKKPDTLVIMGDKDDHFYSSADDLPPESVRLQNTLKKLGINGSLDHKDSIARLKKAKVPFQERIFKGLDHNVTEETWHMACAFVARRLKQKGL